MSFIDFLSEFSYRRIVIATMSIGLCCGVMGTFLYLRRQSLMSDVIGHSATPGVMGTFILVSYAAPHLDARSLPLLTLGGLLTGLLAALMANHVAARTRIGIDATMAVMLSLFLGGGLLLLQIIQQSKLPAKGGIEDYMFGNAATVTNLDVITIVVVALLCFVVIALLWRPLNVMLFDETLARLGGIKLYILTPLLFAINVLAVVVGIKAVGLILMIAFAVFPPAAARQWSRSVLGMLLLSGAVGAFGSVVGTYISIRVGGIPTGPMIVITLGVIVLVSIALSPRRRA